jgi:hypothetical protein
MPIIADPYGLGVDIDLVDDLNPVWGLVAGFDNLGRALARRLKSALGSLFDDLGYGFDTTDLVHQALTPADVARISHAIASQCLLDERVQTCRASLALVPATGALTITITGTIPDGIPFTFVMAATSVTVQLLSVNGQAVQTPSNTNAAVATTSGGTTIVISEGSSTPGPPGPPGPGGSASDSFNLNPNGYEDDSGTEYLADQIDVNLGALGSNVSFELVGKVKSAAGTATFRLRVGGSDGVADGTIVATITATTASFVRKSDGSTIANPGGLQPVKLTIASSALGQNAEMDRGATITIR